MKVLDLRCGQQHVFEGWFASEDDYAGQAARALVACPLCGDTQVLRLPSAPRLNVARHEAPPAAPSTTREVAPADASLQTLQTHWMKAVRHVMSRTEDVGERFPEEARRIHYGEAAERGIRGKASREDAEALRDEGIAVMSLPVPEALDGPVQ